MSKTQQFDTPENKMSNKRTGADFYEKLLSRMGNLDENSIPVFSPNHGLISPAQGMQASKVLQPSKQKEKTISASKVRILPKKTNSQKNPNFKKTKLSEESDSKSNPCDSFSEKIKKSEKFDQTLKNLNTDMNTESLLNSKNPIDQIKGFENLSKTISNTSDEEILKKHLNDILNIPSITNPLILKTAKLSFKEFVLKAQKQMLEEHGISLFSNILTKLFSSAKLCSIGIEMAVLFYKHYPAKESLLEDIYKKGIKNKKPLISAGSVQLITEILKELGPSQIRPQFIQSHLEEIFSSLNPQVRKNALELSKEMYKVGGEEFLDFSLLQNLRNSQISAIRDCIKTITPGSARKTSITIDEKTKSEQEQTEETQISRTHFSNETKDAVANVKFNFEPPPVDIFEHEKIDSTWAETLINAKWQQKKDTLSKIAERCRKARSIKSSETLHAFFDVVGALLNDPNINTVFFTLQLFAPFAKAMKRDFALYAKRFFLKILLKLKEKKKAVVSECFQALEAFVKNSVTLEEVSDSVLKALSDKAPDVKEMSLSFLVKVLKDELENGKSKKQFGNNSSALLALISKAVKLVSDGSTTIRSNTYELLAVLLLSYPSNSIEETMNSLKLSNNRAFNLITNSFKKLREKINTSNNPAITNKSKRKNDESSLKTDPGTKYSVDANIENESSKVKVCGSSKGLRIRESMDVSHKKLKRVSEDKTAQIEDPDILLLSELFDSEILRNLKHCLSVNEKLSSLKKLQTKVGQVNWDESKATKFILLISRVIDSSSETLFKLCLDIVLETVKTAARVFYDKNALVHALSLILAQVTEEHNDLLGSFINNICLSFGTEKSILIFLSIAKSENLNKIVLLNILGWVEDKFSSYEIDFMEVNSSILTLVQDVYATHNNESVHTVIRKIVSTLLAKSVNKKTREFLVDRLNSPLKRHFKSEEENNKKLFPKKFISEISKETNLEKRIKGLQSVKNILNTTSFSELTSSKKENEFKKVLEQMNENLKEKSLNVNKESFKVLEGVLQKSKVFFPDDTKETLRRLFLCFQEGLFCALFSGSRQIRAFAEETFKSWLPIVSIDSIAPKIQTILEGLDNKAKIVLLEMLVSNLRLLNEESQRDLLNTFKVISRGVFACLFDRNLEIKSHAEKILKTFVSKLGKEKLKSFKYPKRASPFIEKALFADNLSKTIKSNRRSSIKSWRVKTQADKPVPRSAFNANRRKSSFHYPREFLPSQNSQLIKLTSSKQSRLKLPKSYTGEFKEISQETISWMKTQLSKCLSSDLFDLFFANDGDAKMQLKGIKVLKAQAKELINEIIDQLDLLFILTSWLISKQDALIEEALEFLEIVMDAINKKSFMFDLNETDKIIPFLIEKASGMPKTQTVLEKMSLSMKDDNDFVKYFFDRLSSKSPFVVKLIISIVAFCTDKCKVDWCPFQKNLFELFGLDISWDDLENDKHKETLTNLEKIKNSCGQFLNRRDLENPRIKNTLSFNTLTRIKSNLFNEASSIVLESPKCTEQKSRFESNVCTPRNTREVVQHSTNPKRVKNDGFLGDFVLPKIFTLDFSKIAPRLFDLGVAYESQSKFERREKKIERASANPLSKDSSQHKSHSQSSFNQTPRTKRKETTFSKSQADFAVDKRVRTEKSHRDSTKEENIEMSSKEAKVLEIIKEKSRESLQSGFDKEIPEHKSELNSSKEEAGSKVERKSSILESIRSRMKKLDLNK